MPIFFFVASLGQVAHTLTVTDVPCKLGPIAGRISHPLDEVETPPKVQRTSSAHRGLVPSGRVSNPGLGLSDECHL